jgi:hypothetical protein
MTDSRHVLVATSGHNAHVLSLIDLEKNTGRRSMGSTNSKQDKGTEEKPDRSR